MLDSNDADQVSPWQPHIVGNKSFMHHVLSVWYGQLNVCLDGGHVSEMYETVSGLLTGRQSHADLQQVIILQNLRFGWMLNVPFSTTFRKCSDYPLCGCHLHKECPSEDSNPLPLHRAVQRVIKFMSSSIPLLVVPL